MSAHRDDIALGPMKEKKEKKENKCTSPVCGAAVRTTKFCLIKVQTPFGCHVTSYVMCYLYASLQQSLECGA